MFMVRAGSWLTEFVSKEAGIPIDSSEHETSSQGSLAKLSQVTSHHRHSSFKATFFIDFASFCCRAFGVLVRSMRGGVERIPFKTRCCFCLWTGCAVRGTSNRRNYFDLGAGRGARSGDGVEVTAGFRFFFPAELLFALGSEQSQGMTRLPGGR